MSSFLSHRRKAFRGGGFPSSPVAEYKFDTDASDTSGNAHNGTATGATIASGIASFDGTDDYIRVPDSAAFSFTDGSGNDEPFSISVWVHPTTPTGSGEVIVFKYYVPDAQQEWGLQFIATGAIQMACFTTGGKFVAGRSTSTYTQNAWMHIVATYDGSETTGGFTIYVDGTDDTGTPASSTPYTGMTAGTEDVFIGAFRSAATTYGADFTGDMDNIRIYDRELTSSDVTDLYNEGHS